MRIKDKSREALIFCQGAFVRKVLWWGHGFLK
nr:MAG TPA: hypothetical protein [Caudoviricetes sp.]